MVTELAIRFVAGALVVTLFAVLGDVLKPKSFAGIFGAAPSVALVTFVKDGPGDATIEGRSMMLGAAAMVVYCLVLAVWLKRPGLGAPIKAILAWGVWLVVALSLYGVLLA